MNFNTQVAMRGAGLGNASALGAPADTAPKSSGFGVLSLALIAGGAAVGAVSYPKSRVKGGLVGGAAGLGAAVVLGALV
jgi:hypothetical protein